ncbi:MULTISPECIES: hypothetical protein [Pelosinus]|uniref:Uncharacterized protein n=1 Tax=Pelosinus fermentans B4 TaxID=1149862 RepID=I9B6F4_9FIRM|nr:MULTISPECIES: hypothetical protein [Pelosinus]EIW20732.1 hypothetical protein FB4_1944 [Pelosinus fermentans B4]EIW25423.1 hypothetical protein FA11_2582 [Pelosinus fermentans A11]OAM93681.1 hypothetical protein FR7_01698 [Pelosinus fermentans DSM 17108]SDQ86399.1 hypothetical protein SAMN04515679_1784 [Pelosinus fermentans]
MTDFADQATLEFYHEPAERVMIDEYLYKAKQRADEWAAQKGIPYVVVDMGHEHYQVWSKALVSKDYKIVHESGVGSLGN